MTQGKPNRYAQLSTRQLEDLLRRPGLSPDEQQAISDELVRRITDELGSSETGMSPADNVETLPPPKAKFPPPSSQTRTPARSPETVVQPTPASKLTLPPSLPGTTQTSNQQNPAGKIVRGCVGLCLLVIVGIMLMTIFASNPSQPAYGTVCFTNFGTCPMVQQFPVGSPCYCQTVNGPINGMVR